MKFPYRTNDLWKAGGGGPSRQHQVFFALSSRPEGKPVHDEAKPEIGLCMRLLFFFTKAA